MQIFVVTIQVLIGWYTLLHGAGILSAATSTFPNIAANTKIIGSLLAARCLFRSIQNKFRRDYIFGRADTFGHFPLHYHHVIISFSEKTQNRVFFIED